MLYRGTFPVASINDFHHARASPLKDCDTNFIISFSAQPLISTTVSISSSQVIQSTAPFSPVKSRGLQDTKYLYVQPLARGASSNTIFLE
ncbi:hypothetical protein HanRHA438_Chr07g0301801 [Helianthus annuus]|nr:hypothetical protein HanRHA438_Chr07g0301801 [Helianthus annuus]